jgi:carbonic anhydrase
MWLVLEHRTTDSATEMEQFSRPYRNDPRPIQPSHDRTSQHNSYCCQPPPSDWYSDT